MKLRPGGLDTTIPWSMDRWPRGSRAVWPGDWAT